MSHNLGYELDRSLTPLGGYSAPWSGMKSIHYWASQAYGYPVTLPTNGLDVTDQLQAGLARARTAREAVYFPPGVYGFTEQLLTLGAGQTIALVGAGRTRSKFIAYGAPADPVFDVVGVSGTEAGNLLVRDLGFDGNDRDVTFFNFEYAIYVRFSGLLFSNINNSAITAEVWWDSQLRDCDFVSGGTVDIPMVWLKDLVAANKNNNNIVFEQCRFETLDGIGVQIGEDNRKNTFIRCKWDRVNKGLVLDDCFLVELLGGSHMTHCDYGVIASNGCRNITVTNTTFDGTTNTAVDLGDATDSTVVYNNFGYPEANGTNITAPGARNVITPNQTGA